MKKLSVIFLLTLASCITTKVSHKENKPLFNYFTVREQPNSLNLLGINNSVINVILPNGFNSTPDNYGLSGNSKIYEILTKGKTFKNWDRMVTVSQNIFPKTINLSAIIDAYIKSAELSNTCSKSNSTVEVVEQNRNTAIIVMQCGELIEGSIPEQSGKQGETTFIKFIFNSKDNLLNNNFIIMYSFRGKTFKTKTVDEITASDRYKEFYELTNQTLICVPARSNEYCNDVMPARK